MPKPLKHVFICSQSRPAGHPRGSCGEKGCLPVLEEFMSELQKRDCYVKIAITNTGCIGPCSYGPNVLVYPEGVMYGGVQTADVSTIFDEHLLGGKPVERLIMPAEIWG